MTERAKPIVAWDCDDVLVHTGRDVVETYNKLYRTQVQLSDFYSQGRAEEVWGASQEIASARVEQIIREARHELLAPELQTIEVVKKLSRLCIQDVVTSRSHERKEPTQLLLDTHFTGSIRDVHFANSYAPGVAPHMRRSKGSICSEIGAHVAIDDNYAHLESVMGESPVELAILFGNYDWNKDVSLGHRAIRCVSMDEVYAEVGRFAERFTA